MENITKITAKTAYGVLLAIILGLLAYIMITQPKVKAGSEVLEIQSKITELEQSIKNHQYQHKNAVTEKNSCIQECTTTRDKQANDEHLAADQDRAEIETLKNRLGLIMESWKLQ